MKEALGSGDGSTGELRPGEYGLTLVELLVTTAVTALLATALATTIHQVTTVTMKHRQLSESRSHLLYAMNSIVDDLRNIGRQTERWEGNVHYQLRGLDGDGTFENSTLSHSRPGSSEDVDRIFFHTSLSDQGIADGSAQSSVGYFLSPDDNDLYPEGTWRLMRFSEDHDGGLENGEQLPLFNTDINDPNQNFTNPVAARIDRLSFRYRSEDGNWYNTWDSDQPALPQVDGEGDLPVAVEVAVRSFSEGNEVDPQWRTTIVSLR